MIIGDIVSQTESRSRWKLATIALIGTSILVWIALCFLVDYGAGPQLSAHAYFANLNYHCALLGFWAGFGKARRRIAWVVLAGLSLGVISNIVFGGRSLWEFETYTMGSLGIVAATTFVLRVRKGTLRQITATEQQRPNALQFGIKRLMIWTAVIAIIQATARLVIDYVAMVGMGSLDTSTVAMIAGLAMCVSFATVVNVWALLQTQISIAQIATLVFAILVATLAVILWYDRTLIFVTATVVSQVLMVITLLLLRMQGFRFVTSQRVQACDQ